MNYFSSGRMARRWGDNDTYFGPFTFARDRGYKHCGVVLSSKDDNGRGASLRVSGFGATFIIALPSWVCPPETHKVYPNWDEKTIERLGRDWYLKIITREYGFTLSDGHLSINYGRSTMDSSTEQRWGCFLPWTQWRHVRHSLYQLDGTLYATLPEYKKFGSPEYDAVRKIEENCPRAVFSFSDFDGEALTASTKIDEREWLFGTGYFKWLSIFRKPKIHRSLDIHFSGETGKRKGSWKGGTIGHSIEMLPGELHEDAFKRYCAEHSMTFIGPVKGAA